MQNLPGKTAFITGGASGIGLGIAKALLGAGMNVVIADIRDDHLAAAEAELAGGDRVLPLKLDVTDRAAFAAAADTTEATFGKIHIGGTINGIVTVLPRILAHGEGGHIVNTASMSALVPVGGTTIYSAGKAAVTAMMECMRPELDARGVICSAFCPGAVQSNIADAGKTRPTDLAETGYAEADKRRASGGNFMHLYQTKEEVGQRVLEGILNDELYILTHSEFLDGVRERGEATTAAVQTHLPENAEYKGTFAMLFRNPAITAEIARQDALKATRTAGDAA